MSGLLMTTNKQKHLIFGGKRCVFIPQPLAGKLEKLEVENKKNKNKQGKVSKSKINKNKISPILQQNCRDVLAGIAVLAIGIFAACPPVLAGLLITAGVCLV